MARAMSVSLGSAWRNSGDSLRLSRCRHERRDDVAVAITECDDLAALEMLVSAIPEVVAAFLRCSGRAVAVDD